jgi:hypothetical protein
VVEQHLGNAPGVGLGNIGPILYGLSNISKVYHDVTTGNNIIECAQGTPNCPSGSLGFNAGSGYDLASGLGSIDVNMLVTNWSNATPTGGGSTIGGGITTTSITTSNALCAVSAGTKVALTITVNGTTTPSGTVQLLVDNVAVGTPANLIAGATTGVATASYSLDTTALTSGGHNISAVYSGDSANAGSKGTLLGPATNPTAYPNGSQAAFDIVSSTNGDFALTPCTGSATTVTVQPGATASGITLTVTPAAGFTGTVTLTATNNDSMIATPTFTPTTLTFTSASAQTTSFVVKASQTTAQLVRPELHQDPAGRTPWYAAGSGATLACVLLITLPRRRRWAALLAVVFSAAALTVVGCGGNTSNTGGGGGGGGGGPTTMNAQPGTYTFTITAVSGTLLHSTQVTVIVP